MLTHQESRMIQEVIDRREEARRRPDTAYRVEIEHPVCDWGVCRIPADGETPPRHRAAVAASCYFADRAPKDEHGRVDGMPSRTRVIFECEGEDGAWLFEKTSETGMVSYRLDELRFTP